MKKTTWTKVKITVKSWRVGDYIRQFSIVVAGIIVTFWGSDLIAEHTRQKEVRATMLLVAEELEYNRGELHRIKNLLDIDRHMSRLLVDQGMNISEISGDTLWKYGKLFNYFDEFSYRTDALEVLKGSSLMQYISDKRILQDVLQTYFELGRKKRDVSGYYETKTNVLMSLALSAGRKDILNDNRTFQDEISFLLEHDNFVNFVIMVPGFLNWYEFDKLDEMLDKQIQILKTRYK